MNTNAIEILGLVKTYPAFTLGSLDLTVPRGAIQKPFGSVPTPAPAVPQPAGWQGAWLPSSGARARTTYVVDLWLCRENSFAPMNNTEALDPLRRP